MAKQHEIVYGIHSVRHALEQAQHDILELWMQDNKKAGKELSDICRLAHQTGVPVQQVSGKTLDRITGATAHQGVALKRRVTTAHQSPLDLADLLNGSMDKPPLLLILDGVQDPHNLGACLRTANAAGANGVVIPKDRAVQVNATVTKVASGAVEHVPVIAVTNLARGLDAMRAAGVWVFGAAEDATTSLYDIDLTVPLALVLGAEGAGLRRNTREHCDQLFRIPMHGKVESLNVSVAAGVCLYETVRQRMRAQAEGRP
jgi:23S rRNA (guanosine2251-2'-O)-methyltransferase